jgi:hypothetical protein
MLCGGEVNDHANVGGVECDDRARLRNKKGVTHLFMVSDACRPIPSIRTNVTRVRRAFVMGLSVLCELGGRQGFEHAVVLSALKKVSGRLVSWRRRRRRLLARKRLVVCTHVGVHVLLHVAFVVAMRAIDVLLFGVDLTAAQMGVRSVVACMSERLDL